MQRFSVLGCSLFCCQRLTVIPAFPKSDTAIEWRFLHGTMQDFRGIAGVLSSCVDFAKNRIGQFWLIRVTAHASEGRNVVRFSFLYFLPTV